MEPYSLHDVSVIIPVRIDHADRLDTLHAVLKYFDKFFIDAEILVIETGPTQQCTHLSSPGTIEYEYIYDEGPFPKSRLVNHGARKASRDIVAVNNADVVVRPEAIHAMVCLFREHPDTGYGLPHNGVLLDVNGRAKRRLLAKWDFSLIPHVADAELHRRYGDAVVCLNPAAPGGASYFRKDVFLELGGFNERFLACVWADAELGVRFTKMGYPPAVIKDANALHLHHARVSDRDSGLYQARNRLEYERVCRMSRQELEEYIRAELRIG